MPRTKPHRTPCSHGSKAVSNQHIDLAFEMSTSHAQVATLWVCRLRKRLIVGCGSCSSESSASITEAAFFSAWMRSRTSATRRLMLGVCKRCGVKATCASTGPHCQLDTHVDKLQTQRDQEKPVVAHAWPLCELRVEPALALPNVMQRLLRLGYGGLVQMGPPYTFCPDHRVGCVLSLRQECLTNQLALGSTYLP